MIDDPCAGVGQAHEPGRPLDQFHAELGLELLELDGQRRLGDEARLGGTTEVAVIGDRHQVLQVAEVHDGTVAISAPSDGAGAEVRMRWSKAPSAAVDPAPMATTICLNGSVVQSPAA